MLKKILKIILVFFLVVYCGVQMKTIFDSAITTQTAYVYNTQIKTDSECYILRDEHIITSPVGGVFNYTVGEGDKLSKNHKIAEVYSSEGDLDVYSKIRDIDNRISVLENSSAKKSYHTVNISKIDSEISDYVSLLHECVSGGEYSLAIQNRDEFLTLLNKRHLLINSEDSYDGLINGLYEEKKQLTNSMTTPVSVIYSPYSGHFYSTVDGYELTFTPDVLENMTVDSFFDLINNTASETSDFVVGKVVTDFRWYTLCVVSKNESVFYNSGNYYELTYPYSGGTGIKCLLENKITQAEKDNVILVFSTDTIPEDFNFVRRQSVQIIRNEYKGLKVSKEALRIVDGYEGVYILLENVVKFKRCNKIIENEDYYIISTEDPLEGEDNRYGYLQLFDVVITSGKELFDGKMIG